VLHNVSLAVYPGELLVLLGPNGAGKSTLVKAIAGQVKPARGLVSIRDRDPVTDPLARRAAGFVPQRIAIFDKLTVRENLAVFAEVMGVPRDRIPKLVERTLKLIGLKHRAGDRAAVLSGGMQRLVNIGAAMMHAPRLLVLDEPTVGVDNRSRRRVAQLLRRLRDAGLAILLTTHDMEEAETLADRISIIVGGEIMADGAPGDIVLEVFGGRQEVRIVLDPEVQSEQARKSYGSMLEQLGLRPSPDGTAWQGLVDNRDGQFTALAKHVFTPESGVAEVLVRQPGLKTLLDWFMEDYGRS
ncbi:MAG: ABC transporter ATP-binding protein, partial [Hyphomicrobiales bacterium]